jgi:hypothetical protein
VTPPRARRALGALALLVALLLGLAAPAHAQDTGDGRPLEDIEAKLISQSAFVATGQPFSMTLDIDGARATDQIKVDIWVREGSEGTTDRRSLREATQINDPEGAGLVLLGPPVSATVGSVTDPATGYATVTIDKTLSAGVYPLTVQIQRAGSRSPTLVLTTLVRSGPVGEGGALDVAFVLPVASSIAHDPDGTVDIGSEERSRLQALTSLFSGPLATYPLTVEPRGETLDALQASAGEGNTADAALLDAVAAMAAGRDSLASPYVDADEEALRRRGLDEVVGQLTSASATARQRNGIAAAQTDPGFERTGTSDTTDTLALRRINGAGYFVVPDSALEPLDPDRFPATLLQSFTLQDARGGTTRSIVSDDYLLALASALNDPNLEAQRPLYLQRFLADLVAGYGDEPESVRGAVIVLPENFDVRDPSVSALFSTLATVPELHLTTLSSLVENVSGANPLGGGRAEQDESSALVRELRPAPAEDLGAYPARAETVDNELRGFESIAGRADATLELEQLRLISAAAGLSTAERDAYLGAVEAGVGARLTAPDGGPGFVGPGRQRVTMTSRRATIPIQIDNRLAFPAHVRIELESEKLDFPEGWLRETTLAPGPNTIEVEVEAKTSGDSLLEVTILPPDGAAELGTLASGSFTVRSTALSGVGLFISIVAVGVLLVWWGRHVMRTRRAKRTAPILLPADEDAAAPAAEAPPAADGDPDDDAPAPDTEVVDTSPTPSLTRTET